MADINVDEIVAGWLSGAASAFGKENPSGPLYVGGAQTEAALTDTTELLGSKCSSCTGSGNSYCC